MSRTCVGIFVVDVGLGFLADVHAEHDHFGRHRRHLVAEAVLVDAVAVRSKRVLAV